MSIVCPNMKSPQSGIELQHANQTKMQWREEISQRFTHNDVKNCTILFGGLTILQDRLIMAALKSEHQKYVALPNPDFDSFRTGKAYGNKAQCNPTYFTVGNLVKYLLELQQKTGMSSEEIVQKYVYVTASGCGPCRFGMYITEYRKALNDAGFRGFRIFSFEHNRITDIDGEETLKFPPSFFIRPIKAVMIGDILTLLAHQMRPYELEKGAVDKAMDKCYDIISYTLENKKSLLAALYRCRKLLKSIKLDRLQPKPKVMIIGEFWAAMTEGDGNYNLHRFLEAEGAEVIPQPIMHRLLLSLWEGEYFFDQKIDLPDNSRPTIDFKNSRVKLSLVAVKKIVISHFKLYAKILGLGGYQLPDIQRLSKLAEPYFPLDAEGGEGHMEVSHLIESIEERMAHMVISVKPFGCMPSSTVSDGIQSLVTSRYPEANFLSIETSGEGAANFYSRVQMSLFKAKQSAKEEFESLTKQDQIDPKVHDYSYHPKNDMISTAAKIAKSMDSSR